jgi:hypothetical protein
MDKEQYNSFDDWFREAATQPGPPVHDAAWQAMEAKLDGEKKKRRGIIFWWWFGAISVAGGIVLMMNLHNAQQQSSRVPSAENHVVADPEKSKVSDEKVTQKISAPATDKSTLPGDPATSEKNIQAAPAENTTLGGEDHSASAIEKIPAGEKTPAVHHKPDAIGNNSLNNTSGKSKSKKDKVVVAIAADEIAGKNGKAKKDKISLDKIVQTDLSNTDLASRNEATDNKAVIAGKDTAVATEPLVSDTVQKNVAAKPEEKIEQPVVSVKKAPKTPQKQTHFYIFGTVAPEWSYVKHHGTDNMSLNYGGGIGYAFSRKWAVQAGVFFTAKKYTAGEGDYSPKSGSYFDNPAIVIESVDADCDVLEIPLSVRYTFHQKKKLSFFATAGLVSTVMKKEAYDYDFLHDGNPRYYSYTYKTGVFQLFSIANLSVGLERKISNKFSLLIAPYFNIPIQGIGEGKVHINSFGLQGGLKYNLPF